MDDFAYSISGKKVNKAEKLKLSFYFWDFMVSHLGTGNTHWRGGGRPRGTLGTSGAPVSSYRHQSSEAEQE